jgi:glycerol-3-phosphate dehydrogenase
VNRDSALQRIADRSTVWDVLVIGGGATGLGTAVEAAARGYRTALLEQSDFAKATSSRSTKLIHGGFRYLKQGRVALVLESLRERGLLLRNAPHLVHRLAFVVPTYHGWQTPYYGVGLKLYDLLAGRSGLGPSRVISRQETRRLLPTVQPHDLRGGIRYFDAQFDDARLAIALARTLSDLGGVAVNYAPVRSLLKHAGRVIGVVVQDIESGREFELRARVVVNATGVFTDAIRRLDDPHAPAMMTTSQGAHVVLDRSFLPGETALMVPKTDDGRVLFAIPWQGRLLVGTTDTPVREPALEPRPLAAEIEFLLAHTARYLERKPAVADIRSAFAGLRPLAATRSSGSTARLSRDHALIVSPSGLVTIAGGKWTTYRQMGEDTVDQAAAAGGLERRPSRTRELRLHGWTEPAPGGRADATTPGHWLAYGTDADALKQLAEETPSLGEPLHSQLPYLAAEVLWAVRHEMARTVEDVLSRRTRALILDARAAGELAATVAAMMAKELGRDARWEQAQVAGFVELASRYLPPR